MPRVSPLKTQAGEHIAWTFYCPGCEGWHAIYTAPWKSTGGKAGPVWAFNGDPERPTFTPSLLVYEGKRADGTIAHPRCHSYVENGRIRFLGDCGHKLKNTTVDLLDVDKTPF